jgi:hypothetical protein
VPYAITVKIIGMPVDINRLTEGWLELESDPGTSVYDFDV